ILIVIPYFILARHAELYAFDLGPIRWIGIPLIVLGVLGYIWCAIDFVTRGQGAVSQVYTPVKLVRSGLYRFSRNPAYVSYAIALLGMAILLGSTAILLMGAALHLRNFLFVHFREEPLLREKFGADYEQYCREVPRWLSLRLRR